MVVITKTIKKSYQEWSCVELALELVWNLLMRDIPQHHFHLIFYFLSSCTPSSASYDVESPSSYNITGSGTVSFFPSSAAYPQPPRPFSVDSFNYFCQRHNINTSYTIMGVGSYICELFCQLSCTKVIKGSVIVRRCFAVGPFFSWHQQQYLFLYQTLIT